MSDRTTLELEQQVLGLCILFPAQCVSDARRLLVIDDLSSAYTRGTLQSIIDLSATQKPIDVFTVYKTFKPSPEVELDRVAEFIGSCTSMVGSPEHITWYCEQVRERARTRRLLDALTQAAAKAERGGNIDEELTELREKIIDITTDRKASVSLHEAIRNAFDHADKGTGVRCTPTNIKQLDATLGGGLPHKGLIICGARPGSGKSALAQQLGEETAFAGGNVVFFSLEMTEEDIGLRAMANAAGAPVYQVKSHTGLMNLEMYQLAGISKRVATTKEVSFEIIDRGDVTLADIEAECARLAVEKPLSLVIVDYLQLVHPPKGFDGNREQQVAHVSRGLKVLAKRMGCPVLALVQLNRYVERTEKKTPTLADIRESGQIEQDADVVMFVHRPWIFDKEEDPKDAQILIAKNRNGEAGRIDLRFDPVRMRFSEV